jgi:hypothetical protein
MDCTDVCESGVECESEATATILPTLGRYRMGDRVVLGISTDTVPDYAPIAVVFGSGGEVVASQYLSVASRNRKMFSGRMFVDSRFVVGIFLVAIVTSIGGVESTVLQSFEVVTGGDAGGRVISLFSLERPEATSVLVQLDSGRLVRGKSPEV